MNIELSSSPLSSLNQNDNQHEDEFKSSDAKFSTLKKLRSIHSGVIILITFQIFNSCRLYTSFPDFSTKFQVFSGILSAFSSIFFRFYYNNIEDKNELYSQSKVKNPPRRLAVILSFSQVFIQALSIYSYNTFTRELLNYINTKIQNSEVNSDTLVWTCRSLLITSIFLLCLYAITLAITYKDLVIERIEFAKMQNYFCLFLTISNLGTIYSAVGLGIYTSYPYLSEMLSQTLLDLSCTLGIMNLLLSISVWIFVQRRSKRNLYLIIAFLIGAAIVNLSLVIFSSATSNQIYEKFSANQDPEWITRLSLIRNQELETRGCNKYLPEVTCGLETRVEKWENNMFENKKIFCLNPSCLAVQGDIFAGRLEPLEVSLFGSCFMLFASIFNLACYVSGKAFIVKNADILSQKRHSYNILGIMAFAFILFAYDKAYNTPHLVEIYPSWVRNLETLNFFTSHPTLKSALFEYDDNNQLNTYLDEKSYKNLINFIFDERQGYILFGLDSSEDNVIRIKFRSEEPSLLIDSKKFAEEMTLYDSGIGLVWNNESALNLNVYFYLTENSSSSIKSYYQSKSIIKSSAYEPDTSYRYFEDRKSLIEAFKSKYID